MLKPLASRLFASFQQREILSWSIDPLSPESLKRQLCKRRARVVQISKRRLRALQIGKRRIRPSVSGGKPPKTRETGRPERFGSQRRNVRQACRGHCKTEGSCAAQPWKRFGAKRCRGTRSWPRAARGSCVGQYPA